MSRNRRIFEDIIRNIMAFFAFICPVAFFTYLKTHDVGTAWMCLLLLPLFLLLYVIREKANTVWLFAPPHVVFLVLPFLFFRHDAILLVIFSVYALLCVVHSFDVKYYGERTTNGQLFLFGSLINVVKTVIAARIGVDTLAGMSAVAVLVLAAGYLILSNMKSLDESLATFSSRANMDNRTVLRFNNFLLTGYVLLLTGIAVPVFLFLRNDAIINTINKFLNTLGSFLKLLVAVFIRWILSFIKAPENGYAKPPTVTSKPITLDDILISLQLRGGTSEFARLMDSVVKVIGTLLIIAIVCVFVITLLMRIYKNFKPPENNDIEEKLEPKTKIRRMARKRELRDADDSKARKIRKRYYKAVKRQKDIAPKSTDTTRDISKKSNVDITALTQEYEQVRYSK